MMSISTHLIVLQVIICFQHQALGQDSYTDTWDWVQGGGQDIRQDKQVDSIDIIAGDYAEYDYDYSQDNSAVQPTPDVFHDTHSHANKLLNDNRLAGVSQFGQNVIPGSNTNPQDKLNNDKRFGFGVGISQFGQNVVSGSNANSQEKLTDDKRFGFGAGVSQFGQNVVPGAGVSPFGQNVIPANNQNAITVEEIVNPSDTGPIILVTNNDEADKNKTNDKRFGAGISSFIPAGKPDEDTDGDDSHLTPWQKLQKKRIEEVVKKVNSTFEPVKQYFDLSYLTGHEAEDKPYHVGTFGKYFGEFILNLPDLIPKDRFTGIWKYLADNEEDKLQDKLRSRIAHGEPLYTNKKRDGGFMFDLIESSPWWHETMTFCTQAQTEQFSPKSLACSLIIDFGLTILIEMLFFKDLLICAGLMFVTGDTNLCLALYVSKLAFPEWYSQDTPWLANNVHLN